MKKNYDMSVTLKCASCASTKFDYNEDRSWVKCEECKREYLGGYNELLALNSIECDTELDKLKKQVIKDAQHEFTDMIKDAVKGSKFLKFK